jgi:flagellar protein FliS
MKKSQTELTYLRSAAQNATAVGLVIILYDLLTHDLELAITALADRDVERRTAEIKHSFLVLQQLEGSLDMERGGEEAKHFSAFYSALRCKIMEAHIKASPEMLRQQVELVVEVRQAWQQVDPPNLGTGYSAVGMLPTSQVAEFSTATGGSEVSSNTWTA